ncbi:MAG: adenosylcobinamide-GDP ribazoletransferase [Chloroflexi bacterium]|nr:MAG: adenosylcobinamide-GDP ribazoletransferase [Chloroflexota bacterium]RLC96044.1 MAG: adenosylcobinamide-GDP ribazoletransferase [Chloroflexota bacterium]
MGLLLALKFLTVIPLPPRHQAAAEDTGRSVVYFPVAGLLLGLILVGLDRLLELALPASLTNLLLVIVMVAITGALHLDGLADTCDGVMLRTSPRERLRIMADSHVGTFGVVGVCLIILLKYVALSAISDDLRVPALLLMPSLSRWAMVFAIGSFTYARETGTGQTFKSQASSGRVAIASVMAIVISVTVAGYGGLALIAALCCVVFGMASWFRQRLGGLTGDTYGAISEVVEVLVLILLPLLARIVSTHFIGPWDVYNL